MGMKEVIREYLQENAGEVLEFFLDNLKIVARGDIVFDIDKRQIRTEDTYVVLVDKKKGEDRFKRHIPFELNLKIPSQPKIGLEIKTEFTKGTEEELSKGK